MDDITENLEIIEELDALIEELEDEEISLELDGESDTDGE